MVNVKKVMIIMLCISMMFSSISVSFANPVEDITGEETVITDENMEEQEEIENNEEIIKEEEDTINEEINTGEEEIIEDDKNLEDTYKEEKDTINEEINTGEEEIIEDDKNLEDTYKEENSINPDESLTEDKEINKTMGMFGVGDTVTYRVRYYYDQYNINTGFDERILIHTETIDDLVVDEEYTFYPIDIEGYGSFSSKTVTISDTSETIEFVTTYREQIKITFIFKDSEGNIIKEPEERVDKYVGRIYISLPDIDGYKTPENFYIDIEHTMVNDFEHVIVYGDVETEPEIEKMTITIQYQDSEGNTIKESDFYKEDKSAPNEYYAPQIEGHIKPEDDKFIRGVADEGVTHFEHIFIYTKESVYDPNEIINIPDEGLRAILGYTKDVDITKGQMAERKTMDFQNYMYGIPIYDYTGLEYAVNVEKIRVNSSVLYDSSNFFETIQSLENVTEFESDYSMSENDLDYLSRIKSLETISFKFAGMGDVNFSPLEGLPNLINLDLSNNNITDISSLVGITQLEELNLSNNGIVSIEGLENFINIRSLNVAFNRIDFNIEPNKTLKEYFIIKGLLSEFVNNTQSPARRAIVTVNHIDNSGEMIKEPTIVNMFGDLINMNELVEKVGNVEGYKLTGTPYNQNILYYGQEFNLNFIYEEEIAEKTGTVIIHYQDTEGNTIKDSDTYTDVKGYYNGYYSDYIEGYTAIYPYYVSIDITEDGAVYEHKFYFSKNEVIPTGTVYIHHQDEYGNTIRATEVYYGVTGSDNYYYTGDIYEGGAYYFVNQPNFVQVVVTEGVTEYNHTFIYNKQYEGTVTIHYQDEEGNTLIDSFTTNVIGSQTFYADEITGYNIPEQDSVTITIVEGQTAYNHIFVYTEEVEEVTVPTEPEEPVEEPTEPTEPDEEKPTEPDEEKPTEPVEEKPTEPVEPTEPEEEKPTEPVEEPTEPTEPDEEKPTEPDEEKPTEPVEPTEPEEEKPTEPEKPVEPEKPTEPKDKEPKEEEPKEETKPVEPTEEEPKEETKPVEPTEEIEEEPEEEEIEPVVPDEKPTEEPIEEPIDDEPIVEEPKEEIKQEDTKEEEPKVEETVEKVVVDEVVEIEQVILKGTVAGTVADNQGNPMVGIRIELHSEVQITYTDSNGYYEFNDIPLEDHTLYLIDAETLREIGRIDIKKDNIIIENAVETEIKITEDNLVYLVDFIVTPIDIVEEQPEIQPEYQPEDKDDSLPIIPIVVTIVGAAGGFLVLFFYFKKRKNLKIYAVEVLEGNKLERFLSKKNIKVHSDEVIIDLSRELEMLEDKDILKLYFNRSLSVKLQNKKVIIMNGNNKVYEVTINEYISTLDIEV